VGPAEAELQRGRAGRRAVDADDDIAARRCGRAGLDRADDDDRAPRVGGEVVRGAAVAAGKLVAGRPDHQEVRLGGKRREHALGTAGTRPQGDPVHAQPAARDGEGLGQAGVEKPESAGILGGPVLRDG
jgi:hypothetical protein